MVNVFWIVQGLRNELSQLRMELSLEQQARTNMTSQMKVSLIFFFMQIRTQTPV